MFPKRGRGPLGADQHARRHSPRPACLHPRPRRGHYRVTHDTEQRLTTVVNAQGLEWRYSYDAAGRLMSEADFASWPGTPTSARPPAGQEAGRLRRTPRQPVHITQNPADTRELRGRAPCRRRSVRA
ncbi:RHS repeat domain-containing protein [Streptomyces sp. NPDC048191]|uniref:RHS repeat domain-containing protein n=1 Tax=Streptomyces sp. NPDC048191 TaxID=3155484 RepID=UPI0033BFD09E